MQIYYNIITGYLFSIIYFVPTWIGEQCVVMDVQLTEVERTTKRYYIEYDDDTDAPR